MYFKGELKNEIISLCVILPYIKNIFKNIQMSIIHVAHGLRKCALLRMTHQSIINYIQTASSVLLSKEEYY